MRANRMAKRMRQRSLLNQRGAVDIHQIDQSMYRPDLGFSTTDEGYKNITEGDQALAERVGTAEGQYNQARAQLDKLEREHTTSLDKEWNKLSGGFSEVRVYNGNNLEGTYRLPREVIDEFNAQAFNQGDGSYVGNWKGDNVYNVDVVPRGTSDAYGAELHDMIGSAQQQVQTAFYENAWENVRNANQAVYDAVSSQRAQLEGAMGELRADEQLREEQKASLRGEYDQAIAGRAELFSNRDRG